MINLQAIYEYNSKYYLKMFYQLLEVDALDRAKGCLLRLQKVNDIQHGYKLKEYGVIIN